jgi:hypothetical protein
MNAATMIWQAAGCPHVDGSETVAGRCYLCAAAIGASLPIAAVITPTFTGHDGARCPSSTRVCVPCAWSLKDSSPVIGRSGGKWRNYSHAVVNGRWFAFTKKVEERRELAHLLCWPPFDREWCAVVAESGQKQLAYRAPVAWGTRRCSVQFEERTIAYEPAKLRDLLGRIEKMLVTFSKTEVASGDWLSYRIAAYGCEKFAEESAALLPARGSDLFGFAVFLAAKPDDDGKDEDDGEIGIENEGGGAERRDLVDDRSRLVGETALGNLAHLPGEHRGSSVDDAGSGKVRQLALFDNAGDAGQPGSVVGDRCRVRGGRVVDGATRPSPRGIGDRGGNAARSATGRQGRKGRARSPR